MRVMSPDEKGKPMKVKVEFTVNIDKQAYDFEYSEQATQRDIEDAVTEMARQAVEQWIERVGIKAA